MTAQQAVRLVRISNQKPGIAPELYFKYVKSKFGVLENMRIAGRMKKLEAAFDKAMENGKKQLGEKILLEVVRETKETMMLAKGIKLFIEKEDLDKHKHNIRGGHISDTRLEKFTRVIPEDVLAKKKKVEGIFDGFVVYHFWDKEAEKKIEKKQKMSPGEKSAMKDPVLFGFINECNRLYYIADWEDELCDLSFEEILDVLGKKDEEVALTRQPKLRI